jgi:hypothetical protein
VAIERVVPARRSGARADEGHPGIAGELESGKIPAQDVALFAVVQRELPPRAPDRVLETHVHAGRARLQIRIADPRRPGDRIDWRELPVDTRAAAH